MIDDILENTRIMKELHKEGVKLEYYEQAKQIIQKYTGTLAHNQRRTELLVQRYEIAKIMAQYKQLCED